MSGLINKIKDAVSGDHTTTSNTTSTTTHGVTDSYGNRQTGLDGTAGTHTAGHNTGYSSNTGMTGHNTSGVPEGTAGPHSSRVANAADPRVDSDLDRSRHTGTHGTHTGTHGTHTGAGGLTGSSHNTYGSTNAGPHDSNIANKADPRVDSDRDGRAAYGSGVNTGSHGVGHHQQTVGAHGALPANTATGYSSTQSGPYSTGAPMHGSGIANNGPHDSKIANKLDPRVDSDRDGSRNMGAASSTGSGYNTGVTGSHGTHTGTTGSGLTGSSHTGSGPHQSSLANKADPRVDSSTGSHTIGSNTYTGPNTRSSGNTASGPHQSGVANTLDPRVDSTTGAHTVGSSTHTGPNTGTYGSSTHTGYGGSTNAGPHSSNMANKADPRVDSDRDGRSGLGSGHNAQTHATAGSGTAQNTAGPHNSDLLNKLDPRVDSDRDGSKTIGGDKTYA